MKTLKLNQMNNSLFEVSGVNDQTIGSGGNTISRNKLIASGRTCLREYMGAKLGGKDYKSSLPAGVSYAQMARAHSEKKMIFCAARAYAAQGKSAPENVEQVRNDLSLHKDPIFLRTLAGIDSEVVTPMLYTVFEDLGGNMIKMDTVGLGRTKEINIMSNDVFLFEDGSWGSGHSTTKNYLYADTVTMNPRVFNADGTIKWYQMVANEQGMDAGWYYAALIRGMWSKIMALFTNALTDTAAQARYVPSYLRFNSYSSANWASATQAVAVANGVRRESLMAFGEYTALQAVLPSGTPSDAALTYQLGEEWMKNGFISMVGRVPLYEVLPAMVPGTINTTGQMIGLGDQIFITARVGDDLAPVYVTFAEGSPITLEYNPSQTADFTLDILMSAIMDVKAIWAGRTAIISV